MNERYSRQILFEGIGEEGQRALLRSRIVIIGCGALGSSQAESLARAGVGHIRIVDRDFVEASNLQRQSMFTEADARDRLPKAIACVRRIGEINSDIDAEAEVLDVNHTNVERIISGADVVLDGTDNFATRYLINDACVKNDIAWVYGAAVGSYGVTMTIRPHVSPCLRCVFEESPGAGSAPTCDTAGVIMPIISVVAAVQVSETMKLLAQRFDSLHGSLMQFDVWNNEWRRISLDSPSVSCPTCGKGDYAALSPDSGESVAILCGRNAVQISPSNATDLNLDALAERLKQVGDVKSNEYLVRFRTGDCELTIFRDGRSIVGGTDDVAVARSLYSRYVGV